MKVKIPDELVEQIYKGNVVLFVGSGLSTGAGLPSWPDLMHKMITWAEEYGVDLNRDRQEFIELIGKHKFLLIAEELRERMGDSRFKRFMHSVFRDNAVTPSIVHFILPEIPFAAVLTTNYDVLLESIYAKLSGVRPCTYTQKDTPELADLNGNNEFYILKVHGDIDRIETVVLGQRAFRQVIFANEAYRDFLKTLFMSRTVLFVGFSLTDPDLLLLLDELGTAFRSYGGFHYALMNTKEAGSIQRKRWEKDYGIHIISYEATEGHPEVYEILSEISEKVVERKASNALEIVWRGLPHLNFIVEGSNSNICRLFAEKISNLIQLENREYSFHLIQIDMENISDQEFFQVLGVSFLQVIKDKYPSVDLLWNEESTIKDFQKFEELIRDAISRIKDIDQQSTRIIFLLFNADTMNSFHVRVKATLRSALDNLSPIVTAVIVAQEIEYTDSLKWVGSPWFSIFVSVKLE